MVKWLLTSRGLRQTIIIYKLYIAILVIVPFSLYLVPKHYIFDNEVSFCLIKNIFGTECYGCGITRSIFSILYLDFGAAYMYNKLVFLVFPLLVYLWVRLIVIKVKELIILKNYL
ncbi:MAG: hypothetical protein A2X18_08225 [Bacteroidetes bacterium GWF2_40_14]|nr:MAG: hypothetical protein A2X18_08225 [Bacteroidetes bacterium GWF2_40_14]